MEIKRIGENEIRCALTETEIQQMGFDIDEIIGNTEITQQFMKVVLKLVEEQEQISLDYMAPMVKAELLQDHSMAITFGDNTEATIKSLLGTMESLINDMSPERVAEIRNMNSVQRQELIDEMMRVGEQSLKQQKKAVVHEEERANEPMRCALRFADMKHVIGISKVCFPGKVPESALYKLEDAFYLILDFTGFAKEEMRTFAFGAVEYDEMHYSDEAQIAYILEHGNYIMRKDALQMLMQL